jgi:TPR repeat protein
MSVLAQAKARFEIDPRRKEDDVRVRLMSMEPSKLSPTETLQLYNIAAVLQAGGDCAAAYPIYQRLGAAKHPLSCHNLAVMHEQGSPPVRKDLVEAIRLYGVAAESGNLPQSQYSLACLLAQISGDSDETRELLQKAASQGHAGAAFNLAVELERGGEGGDEAAPDRDAQRAIELYRQAAEGGHVKAAVNLGVLLRKMEVGELPAEEPCEKNGSRCLSSGCGCKPASFLPPPAPLSSSSEASKWLRLAAAAGDSSALFNLSLAVSSPVESEALLAEAARAGHVASCYNLAKARIRAGDLQAAEELLSYAAEQGDERANKDIRIIRKNIKEAERIKALEEEETKAKLEEEAEARRIKSEAEAAFRKAEEEERRQAAEEEAARIKADDEAAHLARIQELTGAADSLNLTNQGEVKIGSKPTQTAIERAKAAKARRDAAAKDADGKKGWVKLDGSEGTLT